MGDAGWISVQCPHTLKLRTVTVVKVRFALNPDENAGVQSEGLWADPTGDGQYLLENVPFYAQGVSAGDTVTAHEHDGALWFATVSKRGGHSTYRAFLNDGPGGPFIGRAGTQSQKLT